MTDKLVRVIIYFNDIAVFSFAFHFFDFVTEHPEMPLVKPSFFVLLEK
jgi:hypothetical protein